MRKYVRKLILVLTLLLTGIEYRKEGIFQRILGFIHPARLR